MTHKLLLADDSVTIQRVVELTFNGEDVQVVTVSDGEQAIARIPVERPDIVLADIGMPKRSGYDVAAFVKDHAELSRIPVLLLAGAFEPVDEARAQAVRCDGVLVKPFEPQQVVARVRELIDRATSARGAAPASSPATPADPSGSVPPAEAGDDYFGGLDAALQQLEHAPRPPAQAPAAVDEPEEVPTLERVLGPTNGATLAAAPAPAAPSRNVIADVFSALFAEEQGETVASAPSPAAPLPAPGEVPEALVDEVTRRVAERLSPEAIGPVVSRIVSEVAERLIREELARIRSAVEARR